LGGAKFVAEQAFTKMLKRCKPEHGDVLIVSRGATIGKTTLNNCTTPFALMGSVILLKPNQKCLGEFLSLFIASPFVQQSMLQLSGSSAQQAIYLRDIKDMPTPIPPIDEQKKIAYSIRSIDSRIQALTHKLNASEDLKKSMMQDLLTGKVRVNVDQKESAVA
jgi:type I restriction enzyme S subunit